MNFEAILSGGLPHMEHGQSHLQHTGGEVFADGDGRDLQHSLDVDDLLVLLTQSGSQHHVQVASGGLTQGTPPLALCTKAVFPFLLFQGDHHHAGSHCCLLLPLVSIAFPRSWGLW